jgi:hypothetical protein
VLWVRRVKTGRNAPGLLHHVVEPGMLEGREHVEEIGRRRLLPYALQGDQLAALASLGPDLRPPLPVASVEHQHDLTGAQAQDVQEIVRLATVEHQARAGGERRVDEETGCLEIISGHGAGLARRGPDGEGGGAKPLLDRPRPSRGPLHGKPAAPGHPGACGASPPRTWRLLRV